MLLTKECDYGIRIVRALASGEKRTIREVYESEHIPGQYTYRIIKKLERAGILQSVRGRYGGYLLRKPLSAFTLYDVIVAVDDNLYIKDCLRKGGSCPFKNVKHPCTIHMEFKRLQKLLVGEMRKKTMKDVLQIT